MVKKYCLHVLYLPSQAKKNHYNSVQWPGRKALVVGTWFQAIKVTGKSYHRVKELQN